MYTVHHSDTDSVCKHLLHHIWFDQPLLHRSLTCLTTWTTEAGWADTLIPVTIHGSTRTAIQARIALTNIAILTSLTTEARWTLTGETTEAIRYALCTIQTRIRCTGISYNTSSSHRRLRWKSLIDLTRFAERTRKARRTDALIPIATHGSARATVLTRDCSDMHRGSHIEYPSTLVDRRIGSHRCRAHSCPGSGTAEKHMDRLRETDGTRHTENERGEITHDLRSVDR